MDQPDRIHLRDYVLEADIGAFQSERGRTQRLRFQIVVDLAAPVAGAGDDVDRILSYDVLTEAVASGLADQRYNLLETLAEKIAAEILSHRAAGRVEVTVEKLDRVPGALGVTISRRRGRVQSAASGAAPVVLLYGAEIALPGGAVIVVPDAPGLPLPPGGDGRRVALLALDQAAWALGGRLGIDVADSRTELDWAAREDRPVIWAPARMAADAPDAGARPAALALWLARRVGAVRLDLALAPGAALDPALEAGAHEAGISLRLLAP
ncbi:MAG: dihydroneopterin aldolase [Paracoccus sp. (in: a-proteobacteria)]|nr:dihydroneopterin aldolase [Paracoccus sp. (in: a-proteobacteria)]